MEEVVTDVRDAFLDEGVDEAVLQEMKQIWENKLAASKVIEPLADPAETLLQNKLQQGNRCKDLLIQMYFVCASAHLFIYITVQQSNSSSSSAANSGNQQTASQNKQTAGILYTG